MEFGVVVFATIAGLILAALFELRHGRPGDPASAARTEDGTLTQEPSTHVR